MLGIKIPQQDFALKMQGRKGGGGGGGAFVRGGRICGTLRYIQYLSHAQNSYLIDLARL